MKFRNRVYGVSAISCINSNWNADFTGNPKTLSTGKFFGSDKAFKYSIKRLWENEGKRILYIRSYKESKDGFQPLDLEERYERLFKTKLLNKKEILKNLFSAEDVINFGATFTAKKEENKNGKTKKDETKNISITGAVQVMQGENVDESADAQIQDILSPFKNPNKIEAGSTSIGTKITVNEAHYLYGFSINPQNYDIYNDIIDDFEGYTAEAYENFKKGCCIGATALNTNSKAGCENEFALFVKLKENSYKYLPSLTKYIKFEKSDKIVYDLTELGEFLENFKEDIDSIEIYANKFTVEIKTGKLDCEVKDIFY